MAHRAEHLPPTGDRAPGAAGNPSRAGASGTSSALLLAAATLPVAFAIAELTGVRAIGGVVLVALAAATVLAGRVRFVWLAVVAVAFVLSHVIADALTTWGAIAVTTAIVTAAAYRLMQVR